MAFSDYNVDPALNVSIGGVSSAEGCPPANLNNITRQLAADGKQLANTVAAFGTFAPLASPAFTGTPTISAKGAVLAHFNPSLANGDIIVQTEATALPTGIEGRIVLTY